MKMAISPWIMTAIEQAITENDVKLFLMCSPHNPGQEEYGQRKNWTMLLLSAKKHNVLVVADEIHQDIVFGENILCRLQQLQKANIRISCWCLTHLPRHLTWLP